jgi:biotin synthase-related radical SAM superfamily protein
VVVQMHPAKKYLLKLEKLDNLIANKKAEREQWLDSAKSTTIQLTEKVQTSSNGDKLAKAVVKAVDIEREIDECIVELYYKKKDIISNIEKLSADEYDVLHKVYVQYKSLKEVQFLKNRSYSSITSIHGRALNNLWDIVGKEDANEY